MAEHPAGTRSARVPRLPLGGGSAWLLVVLLALGAADLHAQSWRTVTANRQHTGEEELEVEVNYGVGRFSVGPADPGLLYRMELRYDEEIMEPLTEYEDGRLLIGTHGVDGGIRIGRNRSGGRLDLALSPDAVLDLRMEFGAVRADVELGGLSISDLSISTGASESRIDISEPNPTPMRRARMEVGAADFQARHLGNLNAERIRVGAGVGDVTLDFTGEWLRDAHVEVEMGLGALELRFPRGLGVRLEKNTFLTSLDAQGLIKRGDAYYSPDWEEAGRRITVEVDAALGDIDVVWVR